MTPAEAIAVAKRARKLLRAGRITHRQLCLVDALLWSCRRPGTGLASPSPTPASSASVGSLGRRLPRP